MNDGPYFTAKVNLKSAKLQYICFILIYASPVNSEFDTSNTLTRVPKGVAANVAATASTKTQRVSMSPTQTIGSRPASIFYEELPAAVPDAHPWRRTLSSEEKLVAQLLSRGSLTVRPNGYNNMTTSPVFVDITYNVIQILAFSQAEETMSISGWFTIRWFDPRLTWDPEEFSYITEVNVPSPQLWIPDVGVMNGKSSTDFDFSAGVRGRLSVNNKGEITWLHGAVLDTTCPLDVAFFPFDYQTCFLILTPWQSNEQQLLLRPFTHGSAVDNSYLPNSNVSEWEIQSVHFSSRKYRSDMNVTYQYVSIGIHLKRQPLYFVVLVLVPFSMLSALACLIFTLDDTGDRLSVALSLVLSMTMYVVIVSTNAPRSMRTLPVLGIFLLDQLGLLSIATVLAVINNKLYQATELVSCQDWIYAISGTGESKKSDNPHTPFGYNPPRVRSQKKSKWNPIKDRHFLNLKNLKGTRQKPTFHHANHVAEQYSKDKFACISNQFTELEESELRLPYSANHSISPYEKCDPTSRAYQRPPASPIIGVHKSANQRSANAPMGSERWMIGGNVQHHPMCNHVTPAALPHKLYSHATDRPNQKVDYRSPWVEPLSVVDQLENEDEDEAEDEETYRNSSEMLNTGDSLNSDYDYDTASPPDTDIIQTTITATAAAALAATSLLERDFVSQQFRSKQCTERKKRTRKELGLNKRRRISYCSSDGEIDMGDENCVDFQALTTKLTAAAVTAAFHAARMVQNYPASKSRRKFHQPRSSKQQFTRKLVDKQLTFPYRKLASRLDCIEMVLYLLLSTINAIVCLVIMPRFTQDKLPPKRWIS